MADLLQMEHINSLPHPIVAILLDGSTWEVNDIEVETGLLRVIVAGRLQLIHISDVDTFSDAAGEEHSTDSFYREEE
jgi:folylpolyglutamate synthase/dihydropteroate synthase